MCDKGAVRLSEFEALRQEINNRLTISYTLLALGLAAFGTGISIVDRTAQVAAALAAISSILWLYWTDNALSILRIAAYIAIELAPPAEEGEWAGGLGWEVFFRQVGLGGPGAHRVLFKDMGQPQTIRIHPSESSDWYTTALLGGASPVLVFCYVRASLHSGGGAQAWAIAGACVLLWAFSALRFVRFVRERRAYDDAIIRSPLKRR